jgi:hypothetical protein
MTLTTHAKRFALFCLTVLMFMVPMFLVSAPANAQEGNRGRDGGDRNNSDRFRDGDDRRGDRGDRRDGRDDRRGDRRCSIDLDVDRVAGDRSRRVLEAEADTRTRNAGDRALYFVDFDTRNGRGDDAGVVVLDDNGDAAGTFDVPRGADSVTVSLRVIGDDVSCSETLNLNRR